MTAEQVQIRRDTATNLNAATPAVGELGYDTTNKRLVAGDGTTLGGIKIPNFSDIQKESFGYATAGGTADVLTLTLSPALLAYTSGVKVKFKAASTNTTAMTINVNGLGAKNIKKMVAGTLEDMEADDVVSGGIYDLHYDGTQFQIKGLQESGGNQGGTVLLGVTTVSGAATLDITGLITADYSSYIFEIDNLIPSYTSGTFLQMRTSTNNGSSYDAGTGNYFYAFEVKTDAASTSDRVGTATGLTLTDSLSVGAGGVSGIVRAITPLNASYHKRFAFEMGTSGPGGSGGTYHWCHGGGIRPTASDIDAVRFLFGTGNISGTVRTYGLRAAV